MYYYLHGLISMHLKDSIVVECGGIGYDVLVPHVDEFPIGENMFVYVSHISNENEQYFVGFKSIAEKALFLSITSVKGIGPKTAINMLKATSADRLRLAIEQGDTLFMMKIPGIGKKTASQIILDLKGHLDVKGLDTETGDKNLDEAKEALRNLGFKEKEIKDAIDSIDQKGLSVEEYTSLALRSLNRK